MATPVQVSCIKHTGGRDIHGHIIGIGGIRSDGMRWFLSEATAIQNIKDGLYSFYTSVNGRTAYLIIQSRNGHEYLKTEADSTTVDNLLSLPTCP